MASQEKSMPFIKNLASSDRKIRTAALDSLRTFLSARHIATALTTLDVLKLWKGLFYALWMCDRPLPQQQLCADLASLIWTLPTTTNTTTTTNDDDDDTKLVVSWLRGFWATMAREWTTGIDVLRMEKFLLLVRRVLGASLVWMQVRPEEEEEGHEEKSSQQQKSPTKRSTRGAAAGKKRTANGEPKRPTTTATTTSDAATTAAAVKWNKTRVDAVLALLADWPFRPEEETAPAPAAAGAPHRHQDAELMPKMVPVGLKLHALDIWVDEAEKAGLVVVATADENSNDDDKKEEEEGAASSSSSSSSSPSKQVLSSAEVLRRLNDLVKALRAETRSTAVRIRSKESLADERLPWNHDQHETTEEDGGGDEWGGLDD